MYISAPILLLDNNNTNSILKKYVDKLKILEEKPVILHDNILSSHSNKDEFHLNSYDTIKLAENFISRIRVFSCNKGSNGIQMFQQHPCLRNIKHHFL